jgi:2-iminoacetate synthase
MSFYDEYLKHKNFDVKGYLETVTDDEVNKSLKKSKLNIYDFLNLVSPTASKYIEQIAQKSRETTLYNFGKTISLYAPLYISNYCSNECSYCGFNKKNKMSRKKLTFDEIKNECRTISETGIKHILILTGEAKEIADTNYLKEAVKIAREFFASVSIEVYPMDIEEYQEIALEGGDGLTIYQETYNEKRYDEVHISGKKKDFRYRLETPDRGAVAGMRAIGVGALIGLSEPYYDLFFTALHAEYLSRKYLQCEIGVAMPRINSAEGDFKQPFEVQDREFVQYLLAFRIFLPKCGITISTRERKELRDNLIPLGITRMSAGSKTTVGGYGEDNGSGEQFDISDERTVEEMDAAIRAKGYLPIYKDWEMMV